MKFVSRLFCALFALLAFTGCADMLNSLREESAAIDREEDARDRDGNPDRAYAAAARDRDRGYRGLSANNVPSYGGQPRGYSRRLASLDHGLDEDRAQGGGMAPADDSAAGPAPAAYKRYNRQDFVDKDTAENSLWDGQGQGNFLFSHNRRREPGDLITADVEKELKREIQYQLWLTIPPELRRSRKPASMADGKPVADPKVAADPAAAAAANAKSTEEKNKDAAEEAAKTNLAGGGKDEDVVRMEVAEGLGNGLVRVVGQKRVIYRGVARIVEVTALVNGKDIDDNNRVKSTAFLDTKVQVIQ